MRLAWSTDIHLNFLDKKGLEKYYERIKVVQPDALLVTGDISEGDLLVAHLTRLQTHIAMPIYFVLGNHDFYRSSVVAVRKAMVDLCALNPSLHWLRESVVPLSADWAMVGIDGWADAQLGNPSRGYLEMADWQWIKEYRDAQARFDMAKRLWIAKSYGETEAQVLRAQLRDAASKVANVLVLTHIPPFREATWHQGAHSDDNWLPWFSCKAVGDVLAEAASDFPATQFKVLCGHTHGEGTYKHSPNLTVYTGSAHYGAPKVNDVLVIDGV